MQEFKKYKRIEYIKKKFLMFPSWLEYLDVSSNTKIVYIYLLDRYELSLKNDWVDERGEIYCYFSNGALSHKIGISTRTINKSLQELREKKLLITNKNINGFNKIYILEPTDEYLEKLISEKERMPDQYENYKDK